MEVDTFNAKDMERGSTEAELLRNALEEQACDLHTILSHKIKDLEALAMECNQALKRSLSYHQFIIIIIKKIVID